MIIRLGLVLLPVILFAQEVAPVVPVALTPEAQGSISTEPVIAPALKHELTQYGITWRFSEPTLCGRFITGDWWVQGPVTLQTITPAPIKGRHGSVINPDAGRKQGYDDRGLLGSNGWYDFSLVPQFPLVLEPGQSLVSTISVEKEGQATKDTVKYQYCRGAIQTAAVLTCVRAAPPANAFRPGYAGVWKKIYTTDDLHLDRLPNLEPPAPIPSLALLERFLERPWIDHWMGWAGRHIHPLENMPDYGREITHITSSAALVLITKDAPKKFTTLFYRYLQLGIDLYGTTKANNNLWTADGGHCSGRKVPIVFAAVLFDDPEMMRVQAAFQEDQQTYYGAGYRGQKALWRITDGDERKHEDLPPAEWAGSRFKGENNGWKSDGYRGLNGPTWVGQALAIQLMGAKSVWNHNAFFDYVDRWVTESQSGMVDQKTLKPKGYEAFPHGVGKDMCGDFVEQMWTMYRPKTAEIAAKFQPGLEASLTKSKPVANPASSTSQGVPEETAVDKKDTAKPGNGER